MAGALAIASSGYHGPPGLTLVRAFTEWSFDPWACLFIVALGAAYLTAVSRLRRAGRPWSTGTTVAFGVGLVILVIAAMSWTGAYYGVLFYARATQTILLLLVAPLFLTLGRPLSLLIAVLPDARGQRIEAAVRSRLARVLTFPAITTLVLVAVPFVVYFSPWYTACFHHAWARELSYLTLLAPGYVFFWTLQRVDPVPKEYPYLVSLWITGVEVIGDAALGIAVAGNSLLIGGGYYHALNRPFGPTIRMDQVFGGGVLWVFGDMVGLPFLAVQLIHMIREDESDAAEIDAELDAREATQAAATTQTTAQPATAQATAQPATAQATAQGAADAQPAVGDDVNRPWWETDERFTERFSPADPTAENH
ncbi:MAG TPA: cytochrome c oxidase assembly protein [Streptosporangiaceae bacterium]|jgi:cytochrome c oxidase assembly factor CtaG